MLCSGSAVADLSRYKKKVASQMYAGEAVQYIFGGTLRWRYESFELVAMSKATIATRQLLVNI